NQPSYGDPTVTSTAVTLTWSNNGTGATGWRMLKNTPQGWVEIGSPMAADVFSIEDTGLTPGAYYAYWLIKDTAAGAVYAATYITIIPPAQAPAKPAFASAWGGSGQATLTWQDNSSNEDGFRVLRYVGGSWVDVSGALAPGTTTFTDTGLAPGQYAYWITAYNASGTSYGPALISASVY
ncbi:MAG: fibronectin type III domain-containing protein, partial [Planctomycetes bacterium]|nr:fibronectin type III domain-containing protein [Planctomycetota bacterium]